MPNHVTVIGLGAINRRDEVDLDKLAGANLCALSWPMPSELDGIERGSIRCRYRHKKTGEFRSHKDSPLVISGDSEWEQVAVTEADADDLRQRHGGADWHEWSRQAWGTKWGTYDTVARNLSGDGFPVSIEFQCAWNEPSAEAMRRINEYLGAEYGIEKMIWLAFDPYDDSTRVVKVSEAIANGHT